MRHDSEYVKLIKNLDDEGMMVFTAGYMAALEVNKIYWPIMDVSFSDHVLHSHVMGKILAQIKLDESQARAEAKFLANTAEKPARCRTARLGVMDEYPPVQKNQPRESEFMLDKKNLRGFLRDMAEVNDYGDELDSSGAIATPGKHRPWPLFSYRNCLTGTIIEPEVYNRLSPVMQSIYKKVKYLIVSDHGAPRILYEDRDAQIIDDMIWRMIQVGDPAEAELFAMYGRNEQDDGLMKPHSSNIDAKLVSELMKMSSSGALAELAREFVKAYNEQLSSASEQSCMCQGECIHKGNIYYQCPGCENCPAKVVFDTQPNNQPAQPSSDHAQSSQEPASSSNEAAQPNSN